MQQDACFLAWHALVERGGLVVFSGTPKNSGFHGAKIFEANHFCSTYDFTGPTGGLKITSLLVKIELFSGWWLNHPFEKY